MYKLCNTNTRTLRLIYIVFLGVWIISSVLPRYIHPNQFFQSGENFFGCIHPNDSSSLYESLQIFWKLQSQNAIHSIVPPMLITLFPQKINSFSCNICQSLYLGLGFLIHISKKYFQENQCNSYNGWQNSIIPCLFIVLC